MHYIYRYKSKYYRHSNNDVETIIVITSPKHFFEGTKTNTATLQTTGTPDRKTLPTAAEACTQHLCLIGTCLGFMEIGGSNNCKWQKWQKCKNRAQSLYSNRTPNTRGCAGSISSAKESNKI